MTNTERPDSGLPDDDSKDASISGAAVLFRVVFFLLVLPTAIVLAIRFLVE